MAYSLETILETCIISSYFMFSAGKFYFETKFTLSLQLILRTHITRMNHHKSAVNYSIFHIKLHMKLTEVQSCLHFQTLFRKIEHIKLLQAFRHPLVSRTVSFTHLSYSRFFIVFLFFILPNFLFECFITNLDHPSIIVLFLNNDYTALNCDKG